MMSKQEKDKYLQKLLEIGKKIAEQTKDPKIAKIIKDNANY